MSMPLQTIFRMRAMRNHAVAKRATKKTKTERAVERGEGALSAAIAKALRHQATQIARIASQRYAKHMQKTTPSWVNDLLDEIDTDGVGIAVRDAATETMVSAYRSAGLTALAEVDVDASGEMLQHMDEAALRYAKTRSNTLVTSISDTTREDLRDLTADAIEEGLSAQAFAASIEDSEAFGQARSLMIARTELAYAHVGGNMEGYRTSGVVEKKKWLASAEACDDCDEADGQTVALDDSFTVGGEDMDAPPAHPNCRCDVVPVTEGDD